MAYITLVETVVRWNTIEVEDDEVPEYLSEDTAVREQMFSAVALNNWDGEDVIDADWKMGEDI